MALDFSEIRLNAQRDSIPLSEITIVYEGLTDEQFDQLNSRGLVVTDLGDGKCIGRFSPDGEGLFPELAMAVLHLGA